MLEKLTAGLGAKYKSLVGQQYVKWLRSPSTMRVLQAVEFRESMVAAQTIKMNSQILLISTEKCMTSLEFIGCPAQKASQLSDIASQIAHKQYGSKIEQEYLATGLLKIIMQLFVHQKDSSLDLSTFASILQPPATPLYWSKETLDLASMNLRALISATLKQGTEFHSELHQNQLFGINLKEFLNLFSIVRGKPKHFDLQSVLIMAPLIYTMPHSFEPNCYIDGCYYSHENMSYVELSAKRDIEPGETLTINYGNLPNQDLALRHGVMVKNNPFNQLNLLLDFENHKDVPLFEHKEKLLRQSQIQDIERTILFVDKVNLELLQYLRIYFSTEFEALPIQFDDFKSKISDENESKVKQFMMVNLKQALSKYQEFQPLNSELTALHQLHSDEIEILKNNLKFFTT